MNATGEVRIHSLPEALARLSSPYAREDLATLTGEGVLVVDLPVGGQSPLAADALPKAVQALGQLACPTIAMLPGDPDPSVTRLAEAFDLGLDSGDALARVLGSIGDHPQASLALVQLLRHNAQLGIHEGLIAESLVYSMLQSGGEFALFCARREVRAVPDATRPLVRIARVGGTLEICLDRPERHNAFGLAMRDALVEALELASSDDSITEIVLEGCGRSFCSGGDLDEFGSLPDPATAHAIRSTRNPARLLAGLSARTRAEVQGACIGAGVELPAFVSRVTAHRDAFFMLPEVSMGLVPGAGGTVSLPRRIGRQRTAWMALTGLRVDAQTALEWGIIDEIVADS